MVAIVVLAKEDTRHRIDLAVLHIVFPKIFHQKIRLFYGGRYLGRQRCGVPRSSCRLSCCNSPQGLSSHTVQRHRHTSDRRLCIILRIQHEIVVQSLLNLLGTIHVNVRHIEQLHVQRQILSIVSRLHHETVIANHRRVAAPRLAFLLRTVLLLNRLACSRADCHTSFGGGGLLICPDSLLGNSLLAQTVCFQTSLLIFRQLVDTHFQSPSSYSYCSS